MAERFSEDGKEKSILSKFKKAALITIAAVVGIGVVIAGVK